LLRRRWTTIRSGGLTDLSFVKYGLIVFIAQSTVNVLNFAFHAVVSRRIGVDAYGSLNALSSGFTIAQAPAVILTTVLIKLTAEFHAANDEAHLRALARTVTAYLLLIAAAILALGALCAPAIADYLHIPDVMPVLLMLAILAANVVLPIRGILQGVEDFVGFAFSLVFEGAGKFGLAVAFTGIGWALRGALGGWTIGVMLSLAFTWVLISRKFRRAPRVPFHTDSRHVIGMSVNIAIATLAITSLGFSDVVIVKHLFDPKSAGLYSAASLAGRMLFFLVAFVPAVLLPHASNLLLKGLPTASTLRQAVAAVLLLAAGGLVLFAVFPGQILGALVGHAFASAAPLLLPYGIAMAILVVTNTFVSYRIAMTRFEFVPLLAVIAALEIPAFFVFHASVLQIITILIVMNSLALCSVLYPFAGRRAQGLASS
jgi:O-antigen/teichoic acid export membrane protein